MRVRNLVPAVLAVVSLGCNHAAFAQAMQKFPNKPIRVVVGFSPGSQTDIVARIIMKSEDWGQPVVIENRSGGSGAIGASLVAKAAPDGYTLLVIPPSFASSAAVHSKLPYAPLKDFAGVTQVAIGTGVLVVAPSTGVKSVAELITLAKVKPGKIVFGSSGFGSTNHMAGEAFKAAAGVDVVHVAYKGGQELVMEILAGRMHYAFMGLGPPLPLIRDGRLLVLAVSTPQRSPVLPDVPTVAETLPDYKRVHGSNGLLAPAGTPRPILNQISKEVARILNLPDTKERMQSMGLVPAPTAPQEYDRILRAQIDAFSELIDAAGLRAR